MRTNLTSRTTLLAGSLLLAVFTLHGSSVALATTRVALVVGNSAYDHVSRLPNPTSDATDVAAALGRLGFDVTRVFDGTHAELNAALRRFTRDSARATVSLVFYAGHGMEMDGVNYLVPVDARLERDTDVRYETVTLEDVLAATTGAALRVVILDACRNNPLARAMQRTVASRSVSQGSLGAINEDFLGDESLVAYAAAAGTTADDGVGRNSPYTTALLAYLEQPLEISMLFRRVRARVLQLTGQRQRPHEYQSLLTEHYLADHTAQPVNLDAPRPDEAAVALRREELFWQAIENSEDATDFRAYVQEYPEGVYVRLARSRLATLATSLPGPEARGERADVMRTETAASRAERPANPGSGHEPFAPSDLVATGDEMGRVETLVGRKASGGWRDESGWTDLHYAAAFGVPEAVGRLLGEGADVNAPLLRDGEPLSPRVRRVLTRAGTDFSGWTRDGETPLHVAASVNARGVAMALLENGAGVDAKTVFAWTPMHYAAAANSDEVITVLRRFGANDGVRTIRPRRLGGIVGRTSLEIARDAGHKEAVRALLATNGER